jgi:hypothetical protein
MNKPITPLDPPTFWDGGSLSEPAWLIQLAAESDAVYRASLALGCLVLILLVVGFFWATSRSPHE